MDQVTQDDLQQQRDQLAEELCDCMAALEFSSMKKSFPKCRVCRRKHDPRWTTLYQGVGSWPTGYKKMAISRSDKRLRFCSFDPLRTESYEQMSDRHEAERREHEWLNAWFKLYQANPDAALAQIKASEDRQQKLVKLQALADHPGTPAAEARAAREAIQRYEKRNNYLRRMQNE